jgi:small subunit ribosomal protein S1
MDSDPFGNFIAMNEKGSIVKGTVAEVDAKGAVVTLSDDGVEGYIRSSDLARDRVDDARSVLKEGDEIEAKFVGVDRKNRTISLSIKAKDFDDEKSAIAAYNSDAASAGTTSMADLLKEQMDK